MGHGCHFWHQPDAGYIPATLVWLHEQDGPVSHSWPKPLVLRVSAQEPPAEMTFPGTAAWPRGGHQVPAEPIRFWELFITSKVSPITLNWKENKNSSGHLLPWAGQAGQHSQETRNLWTDSSCPSTWGRGGNPVPGHKCSPTRTAAWHFTANKCSWYTW